MVMVIPPHGRRHRANVLARGLQHLFGGESGAGVLLILAAAAAMVLANSPLAHGYHALFHDPLGWTPIPKLSTLHAWINDALMAVFFFVVGLEIKREVLDGELSHAESRRLPVLAAICGMAAPAAVFWVLAGHHPALRAGWAIPTATDIAFALGVLALVARNLPPALRLFLLTVAIVDDLGAVLVIALFYTAGIDPVWLGAAALVLALMVLAGRTRLGKGLVMMPLACLAWYCVLHSGVHATVAGVLAAWTIPLRLDSRHDSLLLRLEHALVPWNAYLVVPLFGFANAGVALAGGGLHMIAAPLPLAIAAGLVLGKQAGIFGSVWLAERVGFARRPAGTTWLQMWGVSALCGIGFTMSLFIGGLAFGPRPLLYEEAKLGILLGSLISTVAGFLILRLSRQVPGAR